MVHLPDVRRHHSLDFDQKSIRLMTVGSLVRVEPVDPLTPRLTCEDGKGGVGGFRPQTRLGALFPVDRKDRRWPGWFSFAELGFVMDWNRDHYSNRAPRTVRARPAVVC